MIIPNIYMCNFQKTNHECNFSDIRINLLFNFIDTIVQLVLAICLRM